MDSDVTNLKLQRHGMRVTPQRIWVYEYLSSHPTHPDADEIYAALRSLGHSVTRATVYNVLQAFVKKGLAIEVKADGTRIRYDATVDLHGHFVCSHCKKIYDFDVDLLEYSGLDGFETQLKDVYFSGVCNKCNNINKEKSK